MRTTEQLVPSILRETESCGRVSAGGVIGCDPWEDMGDQLGGF